MNSFGLLVLLGIFCLSHSLPATSQKSTATSKWLRSVIPENYVKEVNPDEKVDTQLSMYFIQFHDFDENAKQVSADLYLRSHWEDPRLVVSNTSPESALLSSPTLKDNIWIPDIFVVNAIKYQLAGGPNTFVRINQTDGAVTYSQKVQVRFPCRVFSSRLLCDLKFESYGYNADQIGLVWKNTPMHSTDASDVFIHGYNFKDLTNKKSNVQLKGVNYDRLEVAFRFERDIHEQVKELLAKNFEA